MKNKLQKRRVRFQQVSLTALLFLTRKKLFKKSHQKLHKEI